LFLKSWPVRSGARHPPESADRFDIKSANIIEILWQSEEIEKPGRIAEKLGGDKSPGFKHAE
jgi:hypothetical protein